MQKKQVKRKQGESVKIQFNCSKKSNEFLNEFKKVATFKNVTLKADQVNLALEMFSDLLKKQKIKLEELI